MLNTKKLHLGFETLFKSQKHIQLYDTRKFERYMCEQCRILKFMQWCLGPKISLICTIWIKTIYLLICTIWIKTIYLTCRIRTYLLSLKINDRSCLCVGNFWLSSTTLHFWPMTSLAFWNYVVVTSVPLLQLLCA